jgi:hypothetical protein
MQIKPSLPSFASRDILTGQAQQTALGGQNESRTGNVLFERRKKQTQDMQTALTKMQELQKNSSAKNMASQRAALLKQRLDTLKSIMAKLPPGNYKVLAQELKQIAKELAALGKKLGNSGGSLGNMPSMSVALGDVMADSSSEEIAELDASTDLANSMPDIDVTAELSAAVEAQATAEQAAKTAEAEAQQAANLSQEVEREADAKADEQHDSKLSKPRIAGLHQSEDVDDKSLRDILTEARKTLKEVVSLLKVKHQVDDKESRKLFASIERDLDTLDQSLKKDALTSHSPEAAPAEHIETGNISGMGGFVDISI